MGRRRSQDVGEVVIDKPVARRLCVGDNIGPRDWDVIGRNGGSSGIIGRRNEMGLSRHVEKGHHRHDLGRGEIVVVQLREDVLFEIGDLEFVAINKVETLVMSINQAFDHLVCRLLFVSHTLKVAITDAVVGVNIGTENHHVLVVYGRQVLGPRFHAKVSRKVVKGLTNVETGGNPITSIVILKDVFIGQPQLLLTVDGFEIQALLLHSKDRGNGKPTSRVSVMAGEQMELVLQLFASQDGTASLSTVTEVFRPHHFGRVAKGTIHRSTRLPNKLEGVV